MNSTELQKVYDYAISRYGEDAVLCVFDSDVNMKRKAVVLIPTLEELCFDEVNALIEVNDMIFQVLGLSNFLDFAKLIKNKIVNPQYENMYDFFFGKAEDEESIKQGVIFYIKERMNGDISYRTFTKSLTFAEKDALSGIFNKIGNEGIVSINALSKETGISRPVFNNLINKIENTKVAMVNNMGAKGTYIKFINQTLLKERG